MRRELLRFVFRSTIELELHPQKCSHVRLDLSFLPPSPSSSSSTEKVNNCRLVTLKQVVFVAIVSAHKPAAACSPDPFYIRTTNNLPGDFVQFVLHVCAHIWTPGYMLEWHMCMCLCVYACVCACVRGLRSKRQIENVQCHIRAFIC